MRIVVSGGGTAGHITPTLATCDALESLDSNLELLYVGQAGGMEERIVAARGLAFAAIRAGKFRREHFASGIAKVLNVSTLGPNARDAFRMVQGVGAAIAILRKFKPDVVFLKGGYVSVPVGLAARILKLPYVIHESDVLPGLANRLLGRWAAKIAVGFPVKSYHDFDPTRLVYVGNPVRQEILRAHRLEGLTYFKLESDVPVVFVTGGSQGARQINDALLGALPTLLGECQIIHQTGEKELERVKFELSRRPALERADRYHPYAFILKEMGPALAASDLIIGRAGVGTITDSAVLGKATVLIPNYEMAGHQVENARILARRGAARILDGAKLTPELLTREILRVLHDPEEQARLSKAIREFGRVDAAEALARVVLAEARAPQPPQTELDDKAAADEPNDDAAGDEDETAAERGAEA